MRISDWSADVCSSDLYSYAAAALMNPSVVPHHDQSGMPEGSQRIIMSLRAVGEGHISSVAFREGIITEQGDLRVAPEPQFATPTAPRGEDDERIEGPDHAFCHPDAPLSETKTRRPSCGARG